MFNFRAPFIRKALVIGIASVQLLKALGGGWDRATLSDAHASD